MATKRYNQRATEHINHEPMRVRDSVIDRVRLQVEPLWKARIRSILLPVITHSRGLALAGEGFHWGRKQRIQGARIGRFSSIGSGAEFNGQVVVGDLCMLSANCAIVGNDHLIDDPKTPARIAFPSVVRPITIIEADVWIGRGVTIFEGVTIGRGSVIGAGAVITRDVPRYSVMGGVPAKILRNRFDVAGVRAAENYLYDLPNEIHEPETLTDEPCL